MLQPGQAETKARAPERAAPSRVLRPGKTCWRLARADRFALIVDAEDYFAMAKAAMLKARHSIILIGWDFDLRIKLTPEDGDGEDCELGEFLRRLVRDRPELRVYILKWDMAVLYTMRAGVLPRLALELLVTGRVHLRFDSKHPHMAAHHQKIAVIDDSIAFCGGIDMTDDRWDTREHAAGDDHRITPDGERYPPWHDSTAAVDGEAARALGALARRRWLVATGQELPVPSPALDAWPDALAPQLRDVDVAVARTMPAYEGRRGVHEIEALYLAAIRSARHSIYIENQFFASARIADALIDRLHEPSGPDIVIVLPKSSVSWLEEETMDSARTMLVQRVRRADRHGRFRILHPVNAAGEPIYVHSKIVIIDDRLLRVGSSNIDNRSMGFDTECDLALEAADDDRHRREAIAQQRDRLLAEHLGTTPRQVADAIADHGSLAGAVDSLCRPQGRSLRPLPDRPLDPAEEALVWSRIADPERPAETETRLEHAAKRFILRHPQKALAAVCLLAGFGLYQAWRWRQRRR